MSLIKLSGFTALLFISSIAIGHPASVDEMKELLSARDQGRNNLLGLLSIITAIISLLGYVVYHQVKHSLVKETRNSILENESRNMIRLGLRDFNNFNDCKDNESVAHGALISAVTHTGQAVYMAEKMSTPLSHTPKSALLALAGANLAYYYTSLMTLLAKNNEVDLIEVYRKKALSTIEDAIPYIEACQRRGEIDTCRWWDVVESQLHVQFKCSQKSLSNGAWTIEKASIKSEIQSLIRNLTIPLSTRSEISRDWADLLDESKE